MAATTALDMITSALVELQLYAPGEVLQDVDAATGLYQLNSMLDSWSNENLTCYAIREQSFTCIVNQSSYTIGQTGMPDINAPRPIKIITGPGAAYLMDSNSNRYPINVVPKDQWNLIGNLTDNSNIPDTLYYDNQFPLGIINLFPVPNISNVVYFDSYSAISDFASLNTTLSLPPGYQEAIEKNLAVWLKPKFPGAVLDDVTIRAAGRALGNVKRSNMRKNVAVYDPEIVARGYSTYNIYSDRGGGSAQS